MSDVIHYCVDGNAEITQNSDIPRICPPILGVISKYPYTNSTQHVIGNLVDSLKFLFGCFFRPASTYFIQPLNTHFDVSTRQTRHKFPRMTFRCGEYPFVRFIYKWAQSFHEQFTKSMGGGDRECAIVKLSPRLINYFSSNFSQFAFVSE